jgi:hypothetical protein
MADFTQAEYEKLRAELDEIERKQSNTLLNKFKRKIRSLYMSEEDLQDLEEDRKRGQRVMTGRQHTLYRRVNQMEKQMREEGKGGGK